MRFGNQGKNGKVGFGFATYLLLASFILIAGRAGGWYDVRPDLSVDQPVSSLFNRAYDARLACPEQHGIRIVRIDAPTVEAAREIVARDLPLCEIRSVTRRRAAAAGGQAPEIASDSGRSRHRFPGHV